MPGRLIAAKDNEGRRGAVMGLLRVVVRVIQRLFPACINVAIFYPEAGTACISLMTALVALHSWESAAPMAKAAICTELLENYLHNHSLRFPDGDCPN